MTGMMKQELFNALVPIITMFIFMAAQIGLKRYLSSIGYFKSVVLGFGVGVISLFILQYIAFQWQPIESIEVIVLTGINLMIYSFLGLGYFAFINVAVSALRIRILTELMRSRDGLTINEILNHYNTAEIVQRRVLKLGNNGQIQLINNRYHVQKSITLFMVIILELLRVWILRRKSRLSISELLSYHSSCLRSKKG